MYNFSIGTNFVGIGAYTATIIPIMLLRFIHNCPLCFLECISLYHKNKNRDQPRIYLRLHWETYHDPPDPLVGWSGVRQTPPPWRLEHRAPSIFSTSRCLWTEKFWKLSMRSWLW